MTSVTGKSLLQGRGKQLVEALKVCAPRGDARPTALAPAHNSSGMQRTTAATLQTLRAAIPWRHSATSGPEARRRIIRLR